MGNWSYNPTYRSYNPIYNWKGAHLVDKVPNYQLVSLPDFWSINSIPSLPVIPCEDHCSDPQTAPEKAFKGSKHLLRRYPPWN